MYDTNKSKILSASSELLYPKLIDEVVKQYQSAGYDVEKTDLKLEKFLRTSGYFRDFQRSQYLTSISGLTLEACKVKSSP